MVRFLWAARIYRDSDKSCTPRINRGPAAPEATGWGTIIFTWIQIGSGGANVKKRVKNRHTRFPGKGPWTSGLIRHLLGLFCLWRVSGLSWLDVVIIVQGCGNHAAPGRSTQVWASVCHHCPLVSGCPSSHQNLLKYPILGYPFHLNKSQTKCRNYYNKSTQTNVRICATRRFVLISHVSP